MNDIEIGVQFYNEKNFVEANKCFLKTLAENPDNYIISHNVGVTFIQLGLNEQALPYFEDPCNNNYTESYISKGAALRNLGRYTEALHCFAKAFTIDPHHAVAYSNYSNTLREFGDVELALDFIKIANRIKPDHTSLLNESVTYLAKGDLIEGWKKYDYRWYYETGESLKPNLPGPEYDGSQDIFDKKIVVYCEQGFGDCVQFSRYITLLENKGAKVSFISKPKLVSLFKYNYPKSNVLPWDEKLPEYHYHVALLDLPRCFNTSIDTIPSPTAYLTVDESIKTKWRQTLGPKTKLRVGLTWTSNGVAYNTRFRQIDLNCLINVTSNEYEFINLHFDPTDEEKKLLEQYGIKSYNIGDFYDTAGLMSNLDCVISVDTVTAHLSGALGVPTFVLLPNYGCDWRWFTNRNDSPFYNCMKLFRKVDETWDSVIQDIKLNLKFIG